ncbi:3-hydroxyacyl-CoA dehydrogenase [Herbaspirillum sp. RTI4]|uniref:3-hydroxyacyl-CoA dehydrogenase n=1 Tax=Herbaspirillum sp. RTI4 TaxID=3048640 RepID=UPI002AB47549|nr:3-hydroxyacyl-CoA dehydrogenase [Herbaspirillum sp. RTI4]MDY7578475.1 3-hydroxyacyl-CoA dehydrogenase [Herbaspirillum sp. RTI4]MEA9981496.1 3-hydroxyacyl-CoA dehydrogenase [Herbaspirillum sp. RTI4]
MQIENSVFVVTGAGSGLGAVTARMLVAAGGKVLLADINAESGAAMAQELGAAAHFVKTDITDGESAKAAVDAALEVFGSLRGLVNCAGIAPAEKVLGREGVHSLDSFARVININLIGTFNMLRFAAAAISKGEPDSNGERGVIINTASVAAFDGQVGQAAYSASKAAVAGMTLPLAREMARYGIRVMTIAPGIFETPMMLGMPAEVLQSLGAAVPFPPRLGHPSEFAALVRHIAENGYLNAEVIRLDGAIRMNAK